MSILNTWVSDDRKRALIGVDTEVAFLGPDPGGRFAAATGVQVGDRHASSKVFILPHAGAVMAGRGTLGFMQLVFMIAMGRPLRDFDELRKRMQSILCDARMALRVQAEAGHALAGSAGAQEIVIIGWSSQHGQVEAVLHELRRNGTSEVSEIDCERVCPWVDAQGEPEEPCSVEAMTRLARAQATFVRANPPPGMSAAHVAIGGDTIVVEIRKGGMTIVNVGAA